MVFGHLRKVRSTGPAVADRNRNDSSLGGIHLSQAGQLQPDDGLQFLQGKFERVILYQEGSIAGDEILNPRNRPGSEPVKELEDFPVNFRLDAVPEFNTHGLIAAEKNFWDLVFQTQALTTREKPSGRRRSEEVRLRFLPE